MAHLITVEFIPRTSVHKKISSAAGTTDVVDEIKILFSLKQKRGISRLLTHTGRHPPLLRETLIFGKETMEQFEKCRYSKLAYQTEEEFIVKTGRCPEQTR